jgi:hypothetical protein
MELEKLVDEEEHTVVVRSRWILHSFKLNIISDYGYFFENTSTFFFFFAGSSFFG